MISLVCNKIDFEKERIITPEQGKKFAEDQKLSYFETSAHLSFNISEMITQVCTSLLEIHNSDVQIPVENDSGPVR